jgi:hypothetical protein
MQNVSRKELKMATEIMPPAHFNLLTEKVWRFLKDDAKELYDSER